jgi:fatty acid desaturase
MNSFTQTRRRTSRMTDPYARYALRDDRAPAGDLRRDEFEGEVNALWFTPQVDRKAMKALMKRTDAESLWNYGLWLALMAVTGVGGYLTWGTVWAAPWFLAYGILYSTSDHRAHELSHGTPFKTRWLNEALYHLNAFMTLHEGHYWRWSHTRHHTHTVIVGQDPEIAVPRPANRLNVLLDFFFLRSGPVQIAHICWHATGRLIEQGHHFIPDSERAKVVWSSRAYVLVFALTIGACVWAQSLLPAMYIVLPRFYGCFFAQLFNVTQHAGLAEDVHDHRLNTRTFVTNPVFQWLYCNMNFHIEHHTCPMVPWHRLPALHVAIRDQCPPVYPSVWAAWAEVWPALTVQARDARHQVNRPLPGVTA